MTRFVVLPFNVVVAAKMDRLGFAVLGNGDFLGVESDPDECFLFVLGLHLGLGLGDGKRTNASTSVLTRLSPARIL